MLDKQQALDNDIAMSNNVDEIPRHWIHSQPFMLGPKWLMKSVSHSSSEGMHIASLDI